MQAGTKMTSGQTAHSGGEKDKASFFRRVVHGAQVGDQPFGD